MRSILPRCAGSRPVLLPTPQHPPPEQNKGENRGGEGGRKIKTQKTKETYFGQLLGKINKTPALHNRYMTGVINPASVSPFELCIAQRRRKEILGPSKSYPTTIILYDYRISCLRYVGSSHPLCKNTSRILFSPPPPRTNESPLRTAVRRLRCAYVDVCWARATSKTIRHGQNDT